MNFDLEEELLYISDKGDDIDRAKRALDKIYGFFRLFVYNVIRKKLFYTSEEHDIKTVTNEVFLHVWNKHIEDWEFDPEKHETPEGSFKAYLSVISKFKVLEFLRLNYVPDNFELHASPIDVKNEWELDLDDEELNKLEEKLEAKEIYLDSYLADFDDKKRDIVRMYFLFYEEGKNMPDEIISLMTNMFGTTWANIRQIISRVNRKIKDNLKVKNHGRG